VSDFGLFSRLPNVGVVSVGGAVVGVCRRGVAQDRQRLRRRLPQDRLGAGSGDLGRKARGFAIVGRGR
jgi:hypothetical protein